MTHTINPDLLAWMDNNPGLCGYDGLTAVSEDQLNAALAKQHWTRLIQEKVLTDITGELKTGDNISYHLAGYQMSAPSLAITDDRLAVTGQLDSGTLVKLRVSEIKAVSQHDALNGMQQSCEFELIPELSESQLLLDLANGLKMRLDITPNDLEREYAGEFLQQQMRDQPERNRPYILAGMDEDVDPALKQIDLTVQENTQGGRPDLLLWTATQQGKVGQLPPNLKIPGLDPTVNTVLASARLMHRMSYIQGLSQLLVDGEFQEERDSDQMLTGLRATAGELAVPTSRYTSVDFHFESEPFTVPAANGLQVKFNNDRVEQAFESTCTVAFRYAPPGEQGKPYTATVQLDLEHCFNLLKAPGQGAAALQGQLYSPWSGNALATVKSSEPPLPSGERAQVEEFVAHIVQRAIIAGLSKKLSADAPERWLEQVQVGLDKAMYRQAADVSQANDVAMIATPTEYRIEPSSAVVLAGEECSFRLDPPVPDARWYVQALPVSAEDVGVTYPNYEDGSCTYLAASPAALKGRPSKVLLVAADSESSQPLASTLVTTVPRAVTANPMICVCHKTEKVDFSAGSLGGGALEWEIQNRDETKSGSVERDESGRRCVYTAATAVDSYFLEEILVTDTHTQESCTVYVLVAPTTAANAQIMLKERPDESGSFELVFTRYGDPLDEVEYALWIDGQGSFEGDRFVPADAQKAGFVLVFATGKEGTRSFEGHLVLPWPLTDFPELIDPLIVSST